MSYGYSARVILLNKKADKANIGVALGRLCIALDVPVVSVSEQVGVSKQTVYNWFVGLYAPKKEMASMVGTLIRKLSKP